MTLRELFREFVVAKRTAERVRKEFVTSAWLTAALTRTKDFPPLQDLLDRGRKPTPAQQRMVMEMMSAKLGVPLQRVRLIRRESHG